MPSLKGRMLRKGRERRLHQSRPVRIGSDLRPVCRLRLIEDVADMPSYSVQAYNQSVRDLLVAPTLRDEQQYLHLALRKAIRMC